MNFKYKEYTGLLLMALSLGSGCKKILQTDPPINTITTPQVFASDEQVLSAAAGLYYNMINSLRGFSSGAVTIFSGMSAYEIIPFNQDFNAGLSQFQNNDLLQNNQLVYNNFWSNAYTSIYRTNAIIEGLRDNPAIHDSLKKEITGQAEFIRSFFDFYMVNLFGDIPLTNTVNWKNTNLLNRSSVSVVMDQVTSDLLYAQGALSDNYDEGNGQRVIPNKWAATALLARVYLYLAKYEQADLQATAIINNTSLFSLSSSLQNVFLIDSKEAIWQLQQSNNSNSYNATGEGSTFIPSELNTFYPPYAFLTPQLLGAFESGDLRSMNWLDSTQYEGQVYYFPYKYKIGSGQATPGGAYTEYYMVLRLAEQYLIRAEARAHLNDLAGAAEDLNAIRNRAGLPNTTATTQQEMLDAIAHERQVELFCEWGHRWFDLKRTGKADEVLGPIKGSNWQTTDQLYPIPQSELQTDPNLTQNPGY
ncbi:MAG TPA: RagB/SusD family nutrient uptake outer membrane protein [Flavitalea sp.]|nr:RagB/SusD family nutrient uptake outer membrane protein [Flavitalea sp.]